MHICPRWRDILGIPDDRPVCPAQAPVASRTARREKSVRKLVKCLMTSRQTSHEVARVKSGTVRWPKDVLKHIGLAIERNSDQGPTTIIPAFLAFQLEI